MTRQITEVEEIMDRHMPERDFLGEALDIIAGKASAPRLLVRMPQREHLIALDVFHTVRKAIKGEDDGR